MFNLSLAYVQSYKGVFAGKVLCEYINSASAEAMFDVLCSGHPAKNRRLVVFTGDEWAIFAPVGVFHFSKSGCFTSPNLEWKRTLRQKIAFAFSNQHQCPWAPLVSHRAACLLCFIENFPPASPAARVGVGGLGEEDGGGATPIQRLICLLAKRNSRPYFLMRSLIKSERRLLGE